MLLEQTNDFPIDPLADFEEARFEALVAELESEGVDPVLEGILHLAAIERQRASLFAEEAFELINMVRMGLSVPGSSIELVVRSLATEIGIANRLSDRTVQARISEAWELWEDFPMTLQALHCAEISVSHARVIVAEGRVIADSDARGNFEMAVLERAKVVTPGRLKRVAQLAAAKLGTVSFDERHAAAREERKVVCSELDNGMSEVVATISTVLATGLMDRLTHMAKAVAEANPLDPRTRDQIRADLFCELQLTGQPTGDPHAAARSIRAEVGIVIPVLRLCRQGENAPGESDLPASIAGAGPISMGDALQLAADAPSLVRILTDPVSDQVLGVDTYRPSEQLRKFLRTRDGRCRCPSCNRSAVRCDIDHTVPYSEGGATAADNLECLCPGHHTVKHLPGWTLKQISPGVLEWTTPHGVVAVDRPDTPLKFE
ncbi:MAG: DUF222 domain-containing protein [Terrimesophilobacter sp.]